MKVLKFGGKSLANGDALKNALDIISREAVKGKIFIVFSARGNSTNELEALLEAAARGEEFRSNLKKFFAYQTFPSSALDFKNEYQEIEQLLEGVSLLGEYSLKIKDRLLAYGELLSCKTAARLLAERGFNVRFTDSRKLIKTDEKYGSALVLLDISEKNVKEYFKDAKPDTIEVVTGFIGSNLQNQTTTLGRNGSNYSATLLASFLDAEEVQNWTNVNGVYTANPELVPDAQIIQSLSYREANELANFGTNVLHAKTILPLVEKKIPIKILNSFNPEGSGTLINDKGSGKGIKAVSVIRKVALIGIEGRGLLGRVGIDGRIFSALSCEGISVRIISQASSERGIGFIVDQENAEKARTILNNEFAREIELLDISEIGINTDVAVVSVIGKNLNFLDQSYGALRRNGVRIYLLNNTINGEHISLVIDVRDLKKAVNVIHGHIFGAFRKLNLLLFGKGNVGSALIDQIINTRERVFERRNLKLNLVAIADSKRLVLSANGLDKEWKQQLLTEGKQNYKVEEIIAFAKEHHLENVVVVDNTASKELVDFYPLFAESNFDIVASNKHANTREYAFYSSLRKILKKKQRTFLYETNVGAGLPLIDTIKLLHVSGDRIQRIRGVFSGTLSYIFNQYSESDREFYSILLDAVKKGFTEPDPREDLSGNDVGRKLLILAREIDLKNEFEEVKIESLIPPGMRNGITVDEFFSREQELNDWFDKRKKALNPGEVLRYVGELDAEKGTLEVKLVAVPKESTMGEIRGADSIFEI
ncbi:MAG: bifunctional aspartate kinase/homoserine dehydrogenase I, partial [Bacteroidota bacterium]|nr:bifunctional aspartate kinase/homoserine dehydrogenase I [Bacteroidota bacterium]